MHSVDTLGNFKGGYSQQDTKNNNKILIFDAVRKSGKVSRVAVAGMTGLSTSTVSELTEELIAAGLIVETGSEKTNLRGRHPISLMINTDGAYSIVIEILNTGYNCYLCNLSCEIIDTLKYRIDNVGAMRIGDAVKLLLDGNGVKKDKVIGIVFDYPGICDRDNMRYVYSAVVECDAFLSNEEINNIREEYSGSDVSVFNDSVISAYASFRCSGEHYNEIVLFLNMYECIGAGAVITNRKGEVVNTISIEIGQTVQGYHSCLEARTFEKTVGALEVFRRVNSETDIVLSYTQEYKSEVNYTCMRYLGVELERGNTKLMKVIDDVARETALAVSNVCKVLNSENIYIGGMFSGLGEYFRNKVEDELALVEVVPNSIERKIHISSVDNKMKIKGAARLVADRVFSVQ